MQTYYVELQKKYEHQMHDGEKVVLGAVPVEAKSKEQALQQVEDRMKSTANPLLTASPEILWDAPWPAPGWFYSQYTFETTGDVFEEIESCYKYRHSSY